MITDHGVYRSADAGNTWQALEGALDSAYVYSVLPLPDGSKLLAGAAYGLFASSDRGALWRETGAGLPRNSAVLGLLTHPDRPEQILAFVRAVGAADASLLLVSRDGPRQPRPPLHCGRGLCCRKQGWRRHLGQAGNDA